MDTDTKKKEQQQATQANSTPALVSITSWLDDDESQDGRPLSTVRLSTEPVYVSLFTDQGCDVETHYLEATDGWSGGYVHCLGKDCPACKARIERKRFLLLPVADLTDAQVKLLRVPAEKGPGRLRTEIVKVLGLPDRAGIVTRITRARDFRHTVEAHSNDALAPDVAAAIKRFVESLNAGSIDLKSIVISMTGAEMAEHERVAKRLSLEGPGGVIRVIDEHQLADFRARELAPAAMYGEIRGDDHVALVPLPPGIGKSRAAQALVPHALEHGHDLVVYVSPTRGIIDEMQIADRLSPAAIVILKPRPAALCGPADAGWRSLERNGCAALAKSMFCQSCVENEENGGECGWPDQMHRIGPETRLVVLTEQYLLLNPLLLSQIQKRAGAKRVLAILDEALFLTAAISRRFTRAELLRFRAALAEMPETESGTKSWLDGIDFLLDEEVELTALRRFWSGSLRSASLAVQAAGHQAFGTDFRYLAPELELLNSGVASSQWRDGDIFEIAVRVETAGADVMVLAAYLDDEIVEERLARPVTRLLPGIVFRHSETRIINIADPIGTARTLSHACHFDRVVDFFTALAMRNAAHARRTVFVARKRFLERIKARVEAVSAALGQPLTCVLASPGKSFHGCRPTDIPLINYGIVGVNSLEAFDALYCIGGYYARADHLNAVYQQALPPDSRMPIGIRMEGRRRRVYAADYRFDTRFHARRAAATHRMLERRVVLQAIGRVRPFTTPAEIILFQCDDLSSELGPVEEFSSLSAARRALAVPTLSRLKRATLGEKIRVRQKGGDSLRAIATTLDIAPSTASLAARAAPLDRLVDSIRSWR